MDPSILSIDGILNQLEEHAASIENQQKQIESLQQELKEIKSKKK